jgi:hypothetical protein
MKNNKALFSTTLIIIGENIDTDEISAMLEMKPNKKWERGQYKEIRIGRNKKTLKSKNKMGCWKKFIDSTERKKSLEKQLQYWVDVLSTKKKILTKIRKRGNKIILDCFIASTGAEYITLNADIMGKLSGMGVCLDISYYPD